MRIKLRTASICAAVFLFVSFFSSMAMSETSQTKFTPEQKTEIETIIEQYLVTKPEVLIKATQVLQQRQQAEQERAIKEAVSKNAETLLSGKNSPMAGNPNGKVALVEFFDYQCVHCKHMAPVVEKLIKSNPDLKVIFKQFPIFGETSQYAALAAVAAYHQDPAKFLAFHKALMEEKKALDKDTVLKAAKAASLDLAKLKTEITSKATKEEIENNMLLAGKMGLRFTPVFIISKNPFDSAVQPAFVPGAASQDALQKVIDKTAKS